jgi:hypothetical protein
MLPQYRHARALSRILGVARQQGLLKVCQVATGPFIGPAPAFQLPGWRDKDVCEFPLRVDRGEAEIALKA